jgi:hypothetical protein
MRRVFNLSVRGVAALAVMVMVSTSVFAVPAESRDRERGRERDRITKIIKKVVRALGDGLTVPIGNPKP